VSELVSDPVYVAARAVLLDALQALGEHRSAAVVVGAQAVYLQTGDAGLSVAPFTSDGDLALDPAAVLLVEDPLLGEAMEAAGFELRINARGGLDPGTWLKYTVVEGHAFRVPVDLIIPRGTLLAAGNTRGARLGVHGKTAAMQTRGLEAVLVDQQVMTVTDLGPGDCRHVSVAVAGVGALLVAKVIKLRERVNGRPGRLKDKDAGDIYRLIRATPVDVMAARLDQLRRDNLAGSITAEAVDGLEPLFRAQSSPGVTMAVRAVEQDVPAARVIAQMTTYVMQLRHQLTKLSGVDTAADR